MEKKEYFESLANYGKDLLNRLPIKKEVQPLEYAVNELYGKLKEIKNHEIEKLKAIKKPEHFKSGNVKAIGLNTVGLLTDRFTILLVKEWCLKNKKNNPENAKMLYDTQTIEIIDALVDSHPGNSSINSKITNKETIIHSSSWEEAFYSLLAVNIVLWESQEVLYIKDISILPAEELRGYISWFAKGNLERNVLIELCEKYYWQTK